MSKKFSGTHHFSIEDCYPKGDYDIQFDTRSNRLNMLLLINDDGLGSVNNSLSQSLKSGLIKALAQKEPYPSVMIFLNRGVYLTAETSSCLSELKLLESRGVLILSNCTCLDYYGLMDKLAVGGVTNLYHIAELIKLAKNTISL